MWDRAQAVLARIALIPVDEPVLRTAAMLEPLRLRSLDAIHLATALTLGDDLGEFGTYDGRLADAAMGLGLFVASPDDR